MEKADHLPFIYLNARSCRNKTLEINDLISEKNADLLFISGTWLSKMILSLSTRWFLTATKYCLNLACPGLEAASQLSTEFL